MHSQTGMFVMMLLYFLATVAIVGTVLLALWRLMKAHESNACGLEGVERALRERA